MVFRRICVILLLIAGLAFMGLTFASMAEGQGKKDQPGPGRVNWKETKIAYDMRGKPWDATIKWFCQQVQMPLVGKYPAPPGTITFYNINGPDGMPHLFAGRNVRPPQHHDDGGVQAHHVAQRSCVDDLPGRRCYP